MSASPNENLKVLIQFARIIIIIYFLFIGKYIYLFICMLAISSKILEVWPCLQHTSRDTAKQIKV